MKPLYPFSLICYLFVALGVLFSGFSMPETGKTAPYCAAVSGEPAENTGEALLSEADVNFCMPASALAGATPYRFVLTSPFCTQRALTKPAQPSEWRMPARI